MRHVSVVLLSLLALCGCADGHLSNVGTFLPPEHAQQLAQRKVCCSSYREIRYGSLEIGKEVEFAITPESPIFEFKDGRSFFSAFELPVGKARILTLKTYPVNTLYNLAGHVLVPSVQFLDAELRVIDAQTPKYIARYPRVIGRPWGEAEINVPSAAQFVVILDGKSSGGLSWRDRDQRSGFLFVRSGPTGELSINLSGS